MTTAKRITITAVAIVSLMGLLTLLIKPAIAAYLITSSSQIKDGVIKGVDIYNGTITAYDLATDSVNYPEIKASAVRASEIASSAVGASEIASSAVGASEVAAGAIGTSEIATNGAADVDVVDALTINGGAIDDTPIGSTTQSSGDFTSLTATGNAVFISNVFLVGGFTVVTGVFALGVDVLAIDDNGAGTPAAGTLEINTSFTQVQCNDADGCNVTMGETNAVDGDIILIVNALANTANFADTAGVSELSGAFAADQWDTIMLLYEFDRWVEVSRSNN